MWPTKWENRCTYGKGVKSGIHSLTPHSRSIDICALRGVQKDRMSPQNMCALSSDMCRVSSPSPRMYLHKPPRLSAYGPRFMKAKCYKCLFDVAVSVDQTGLGLMTPSYGSILSFKRAPSTEESRAVCTKVGASDWNSMEPSYRFIVLDIEGTTTPISFVTDVLFPYARDNVGLHLSLTYDSPETQDDIKLLRAQVEEDLKAGLEGVVLIPSAEEGKDKVISALVTNVEAMIKADRKITALKELQGHIWRTGFRRRELEAVVFEDVPKALERWHALGIKVYIYSSGSRLAQRLIFGNTSSGDLRKYLCGFFDTKVGNKRETQSYVEISESVGVDHPSEILFVTDVYQEAIAAKAAGMEVIISVRPGNGTLPDNHGFKTVTSFAQI